MALEEARRPETADYGSWEDAIHELAAFERPSASAGERRAAEWIAQRLGELGCQVEDKGITFTIHFRNSPRADHARRYLETQIAPKLERAGLAYNYGRMVLEVRPPVAVDKGAAVRRLRGRRRIDNLLFVGDDRSDLDAFREATIRVAVHSAEAPRQLLDAADAIVEGPGEVVELLNHLADPA